MPGRFSRREFLRASGLGAAALVAAPELLRAQDVVVPGKERMIIRSLRYLDLETPAHLLDSFLTPVDLFYVRNHLAQPGVNLAEWRLEVTGEVEEPLALTLDDLEKFERATVTNTLECAGNGRAFQRPRVPGIQWTRGAVGNASFSGARLADVLRRARPKASGKHVVMNGLDEPSGRVPDFIRSIPIEKALHPDTLLATRMNGAPLRIEHGFPCRAVVPGWLGAASVKWLVEIRVTEKEFDGNFMRPAYRMPARPVEPGGEVSPDETQVITSLPVKSIITQPGDGATLKAGATRIAGAAWAGEADIVRVDVSTDGGQTWQAASLGREQARYAWRLWEYAWTPPRGGRFTLLSRATDSAGRTQPMTPQWNPSGYLWNAADRVVIHVES
jgi:DMSO/TMAO reductase YedYZ molybdopterin-dependent catalytic subunit